MNGLIAYPFNKNNDFRTPYNTYKMLSGAYARTSGRQNGFKF